MSVFAVMHTSASLTVNENASFDVLQDLNVSFTMMARLQPWRNLFSCACVTRCACTKNNCPGISADQRMHACLLAENFDLAFNLEYGRCTISDCNAQYIHGVVIVGLAGSHCT